MIKEYIKNIKEYFLMTVTPDLETSYSVSSKINFTRYYKV